MEVCAQDTLRNTATLMTEERVKDACVSLDESVSLANSLQLRVAADSVRFRTEQCPLDPCVESRVEGLTSREEFLTLPRIQVDVDASSRLSEITADDAIVRRLLPSVMAQLEVAAKEADSHYRRLEEGVVRLVLPPLERGEDPRSGEISLAGRYCSPEKPCFAVKLRKSPARKLLLDEAPLGGGIAEEEEGEEEEGAAAAAATWKLIAFAGVSELSAVCLAQRRSSLFVLNVLLSSTGGEEKSHLLPTSPTTGVPLTTSSAFLAHMSVARGGFGVAATTDGLIAVGGFSRDGCHALIERYNFVSNTWEEVSRLDRRRARFAFAAVGGVLYSIGGSDGRRELASVESFSTSAVSTRRVSCPMPTARSCCSAAELDGRVYVIGGSGYSVLLRTVERFDPAAREWTTLPPLRQARIGLSAVSCAGKVYAIGGQTHGWKCLGSVECYNPANNVWKEVASMRTPRRGAAAVTVDDKIWVIGGFNGSRALRSVEVYDPRTDTWSSGPSTISPRSSAVAVLCNGTVYLVGGFSGSVFLNSVEQCSLERMEWTSLI